MKANDVMDQLLATYGAMRIERLYGNADQQVVLQVWQRALLHLSEGQITWALDHLPMDHPPNALEFAALARTKPQPVQPLPERYDVPADPERVRKALERPVVAARGPKQWAYDLAAREKAGERLTLAQRDMWRRALGIAPHAFPAEVGEAT